MGPEAERAEQIIEVEAQGCHSRQHSVDVVPTIASLQDHLETIRQAEIDRARRLLGRLSLTQELAIASLTRGIVNKIMQTPINILKTAARESEAPMVINLVKRLFNLRDKGAAEFGQTEGYTLHESRRGGFPANRSI